MSRIHFIDTSVFVELLNIPGMNANHSDLCNELDTLVKNEDMFVLPVATLVETGNHIAHVSNGNIRRSIADMFSQIVQKAVDMEDNWSVLPEISTAVLKDILNQFPSQAAAKTGFGDVSIIEQFEDYWKNKQPIGEMRIWSKDQHLQSYSRVGGLSRRRNK